MIGDWKVHVRQLGRSLCVTASSIEVVANDVFRQCSGVCFLRFALSVCLLVCISASKETGTHRDKWKIHETITSGSGGDCFCIFVVLTFTTSQTVIYVKKYTKNTSTRTSLRHNRDIIAHLPGVALHENQEVPGKSLWFTALLLLSLIVRDFFTMS
jgi:hypothetical protein